jgi:hypothetical protein
MDSNVAKILGEDDRFVPRSRADVHTAMDAYMYAHFTIKRPWPEAEHLISKEPRAAFRYAYHVLDCQRFLRGEPAIASDASHALQYARNILRGPWPEAEPTLLADPQTKGPYIKFLKDLGVDVEAYFRDRIASGEVPLEDVYGQ